MSLLDDRKTKPNFMKKILWAIMLLPCVQTLQAQETENTSWRKEKHKQPPAKFILSASPVHVTEQNIGVGLSAEIFTNKTGMLSIVLPVSYSFASNTDNGYTYYNYGYYYYPNYPYNYQLPPTVTSYTNTKGMLYFYPGIKIYPTGANKKVSYAVGANLVIGFGSAEKTTTYSKLDSSINSGYIYYYTTPISQDTKTVSHMKLGFLISNSLNIRPTQHLFMGVDFGIGYSYLDVMDGKNQGTDVLLQLGLKFGFVK